MSCYEIMTGRVPFQGESTHSVMMQHVNAAPTPPSLLNPYISPLVSSVLLRGLAKNPADRFPTATALAVAFSNATQISVPLEVDAGKWEEAVESVMYTGPEARSTTPNASTSRQRDSEATILRAGITPRARTAPTSAS